LINIKAAKNRKDAYNKVEAIEPGFSPDGAVLATIEPVILTLPRTVSPAELALVNTIQLAATVIPSLGQIQRVLVIVLNHN
jgi:hypothetical protein